MPSDKRPAGRPRINPDRPMTGSERTRRSRASRCVIALTPETTVQVDRLRRPDESRSAFLHRVAVEILARALPPEPEA